MHEMLSYFRQKRDMSEATGYIILKGKESQKHNLSILIKWCKLSHVVMLF